MSEYELLNNIEDAEEFHREVVAKWRWVRWGIPASVAATVVGALIEGLGAAVGVDAGTLAVNVAVPSMLIGVMFFLWFMFTVPRRKIDSFTSSVVFPRDSAKQLRDARRKHVEYTMRSQS